MVKTATMSKSTPTKSSPENQLLRQIAKPIKRQIYAAWLLTVAATFVLIAQSWLLATVFASWLTAVFGQANFDAALLVQLLPWLAGCLVLRPLLLYLKDKLALDAGLTVVQQVRKTLLNNVAALGDSRYQYGNDGSLTSQILNQTDSFAAYFSRFTLQKYVTVSTPILLLLAAASQSLVAAGVMFLTAPLVPIFMILIGSATKKKSEQQFDALAQLSGRFLDWVRGIQTLQRLNATATASLDIEHASKAYRLRTMDVLKIAFLNAAALELLAALSIAILAVYLGFGLLGILPWQKNSVPVPYQPALFLLLLAPEFYAPLRQLGADYHVKAQAEAAATSLLPLLSHEGLAVPALSTQATIAPTLAKPPCFSLNQLMVTTPDARVRLPKLSAVIPAGVCTAVMGESGSGKSTLLQVLLGFCHYQGQILMDEQDFATLDQVTLRGQIAYLSQQTTLLPMSIADNLRLAHATASDSELVEALQQVQLWQLIEQLPNGIDTVLGERGAGLSGGQQRRLAIAQLLLQQSNLWLLDEPTEHLDPQTAEDIEALLKQVTHGKTVIWVTHDARVGSRLDHQLWLAGFNHLPSLI